MTARVLSEPYTPTDPLSLFPHLSPCFSSHVCDAMEPQTQIHIELCDDVSAHMFLIVPHSSCSIDRAAPEMSKHAADRSSAPVPGVCVCFRDPRPGGLDDAHPPRIFVNANFIKIVIIFLL